MWYEKAVKSKDKEWTFHVDIYVPPKTVIEVDGRSHWSKRAQSKDRWKDAELKKVGLHVVRITVEEALGAPEQVLPQLRRIHRRR